MATNEADTRTMAEAATAAGVVNMVHLIYRNVPALQKAAGKTKHARAARRMVAIALVLEGVDRETADGTCGMDRQTLRGEEDQETVRGTVSPTNGHRYNAEGLDGLVNRRVVQHPRRLTQDQMATLACWVEAGPDPEKGGVVRLPRAKRDTRPRAKRDTRYQSSYLFGAVCPGRAVAGLCQTI